MAELSDRARIGDLVRRYACLVDRRDLDAAAELFTEDAVLVLPDPPARLDPVRVHSGREEIRRALSAVADAAATHHEVTFLALAVCRATGTATGTVTGVAHHVFRRRGGDAVDVVWHLRYADTYRREAGRWRIARRELGLDRVERRVVTDGPAWDETPGEPSRYR